MDHRSKMIFMVACLVGFIFIGTVFPANAATYYVDYASGSNSNNGSSTSTPWKHCPGDPSATGNAASKIPAVGDIFYFKGGVTYNSGNLITLLSSGSSDSNRIIYDGNNPSFGNGNKAILSGNTGFNGTGKSYITIRNFEITGFTDNVINFNYGSGLTNVGDTVTGNYIHDGWIPQYGAVMVWNSQNFTLSNNVFEYVNCHRNGFGTNTGSNSSTTLTDSSKNWTSAVQAQFIGKKLYNQDYSDCKCTITGATSNSLTCSGGLSCGWHNGDHYGIMDNGRGPTYFQCNFSGSSCTGDSTGTTVKDNTIYFYGDSPLFFFGQSQLTVYGNTITGVSGTPHSQGITHYNANGGSANIYKNYYDAERAWLALESLGNATVNVYNNIANSHNNVSWNITCWSGSSGTLRIVNNVLINSGSSNQSVVSTSSGLSIIYRNNISDGGVGTTGGALTSDHNCYIKSTDSETGTIHVNNFSQIFQNPALTSPTDYNIISTFAGKDTGYSASVYGITDDFVGTSRPQGSGWDIGAYEKSGQSGASPPAPSGFSVGPQ